MAASDTSPVSPFTGIIDIHHDDGKYNLDELRAGGVRAIVHKASEGEDFVDKGYRSAVANVKSAGLLRGAYHFCTGTRDGRVQADHFLKVIGDDIDDLLLMMDWESNPNPKYGDMTVGNLVMFAERIKSVTGRWPFLYSFTHYFKKNYKAANATLSRCPLWISQFGEKPQYVPPGFAHYELWQYTNGKYGPRDQRTYPRVTPGFKRDRQDRNAYFGGGADNLAVDWIRWGRW